MTGTLKVIVSDVCGPIKPLAIGAKQYFVTFTDVHSKYTRTYPMARKSDAFELFIEYHTWAEKQLGKSIMTLRSDGGGEYLSDEFTRYLKAHSIHRETTAAYTPQQNGIPERKIARS